MEFGDNKNHNFMKTVKYILSGLFILGGLGSASQGAVVSGVSSIILGVLLLPQISDKLKENINIWNKKMVRYVSYVLLLIVLVMNNTNSPYKTGYSSNTNKQSEKNQFQAYGNRVAKNVKKLPEERKKLRANMIAKLKQTATYKKLIEEKVVSSEYLPVLSLINNGVRSQAINSNGESVVLFEEGLMNNLKEYDNFEDKQDFAVKTAILATENKGGFINELVEVFARYRDKYNLYGNNSKRYDVKGNLVEEVLPYNISAIFYHIQPNEENFKAIYDANKKGISDWFGERGQGRYIYEYFTYKQNYLAFAKKYYPNNPYIMKVDMEISASRLYSAYEQNEVSADEKYKGKKLGVTGVIGNIGKDVFDNPYISLKIDYLQSVNCYFDDDNIKVISQLQKGQEVTIIGVCDGKSITDVILKDCKLWNE